MINLEILKNKYFDYQWLKKEINFSDAIIYYLQNEKQSLYLKCYSFNNSEIINEVKVLKFLKNKLPVPGVVEYATDKDFSYIIKTSIEGNDLKAEFENLSIEKSLELMAKGLKAIHNTDIDNYENIDKKDIDTVFIHGDYCPINIIINNNDVAGIIDWGSGGIGNRYIDLAEICFIIQKHFGKESINKFIEYYGYAVNINKLDEYIKLFCKKHKIKNDLFLV